MATLTITVRCPVCENQQEIEFVIDKPLPATSYCHSSEHEDDPKEMIIKFFGLSGIK